MISRRTGPVLVTALVALYRFVLRRRILNWGATETEAASRLPGDELLEQADGVSTRAITIKAPPASIWPWVAQMGRAPRGERRVSGRREAAVHRAATPPKLSRQCVVMHELEHRGTMQAPGSSPRSAGTGLVPTASSYGSRK